MKKQMKNKLYIDVDTIVNDFDVSKAKAYTIIRELNRELKKKNPEAIIIAGKVNRVCYDKACLRQLQDN